VEVVMERLVEWSIIAAGYSLVLGFPILVFIVTGLVAT
jgi:hypothetical protein